MGAREENDKSAAKDSQSPEDLRREIIRNYRESKKKVHRNPAVRLLKWLQVKQLQFDSAFGATVYNSAWERALIYILSLVLILLVIWGAVLQIQQVIGYLVELKDSFIHKSPLGVQPSQTP